MRDSLYDDTVARSALAIATRTANSAVNGLAVDKNYQNNRFRAVMFVIQTGTVTDGTTTFTMQDSDDASSWSGVNSLYVQGTLPVVGSAHDDTTYEIGYTGDRRYVRLVATQAGATSGATIGAVAIMSSARKTPVTH